jgi:hypothetical protein
VNVTESKPTNGNGGWQDVRVSLGPDAEVTGKLSFATPTRIEGKLKGELRATDLLVIGAQAVVQANVHAEKLVVLGEVRGQVRHRDEVPRGTGRRDVRGSVEDGPGSRRRERPRAAAAVGLKRPETHVSGRSGASVKRSVPRDRRPRRAS